MSESRLLQGIHFYGNKALLHEFSDKVDKTFHSPLLRPLQEKR